MRETERPTKILLYSPKASRSTFFYVDLNATTRKTEMDSMTSAIEKFMLKYSFRTRCCGHCTSLPTRLWSYYALFQLQETQSPGFCGLFLAQKEP